jgi:hydroxyethylthiazole kinase-like uncharacterized protein yjeF
LIPILSASQVREADRYTIENEPIASIELMERASAAFVKELTKRLDASHRIIVVVGTGNNGGDGLAIARLLDAKGYRVSAFAVGQLEKSSPDFKSNYELIKDKIAWVEDAMDLPDTHNRDIIVDALFGSGLSRSLGGLYGEVVEVLNKKLGIKVSVDIASGLMVDNVPSEGDIIFEPDLTITFQCPKLTFVLPYTAPYVGEFVVVDIGLDLSIFSRETYKFQMTTADDLVFLNEGRNKYAHKGDFGRLQLIGGSEGKFGSIALSSQAAMRSGTGLLYVTVPQSGASIIHQLCPEAMVHKGDGEDVLSDFRLMQEATVIGIGPGLGTSYDAITALDMMLSMIEPHQKLVLDADVLNILAKNPDWLDRLPKETILTPHPGEFRRLVGDWNNDVDKLERLSVFCERYSLNVVVKGAYSAVCDATGNISFNPTGNPGMASAGSGDVLLGIVAGLLATGILPRDALKVGVYVHGLSGDLGAKQVGQRSLIASDIITNLPNAFTQIKKTL